MQKKSRGLFDPYMFLQTLQDDIHPYLPLDDEWNRAESENPYQKYQISPVAYSEEVLRISPWSGGEHPGQRELFEDIGESVRLQLERKPANRIFRIEAGHGVGKTFGAAILVNWFFDSFAPSITYTTAPTKEQLVRQLWKNVKAIRPNGLPGRVFSAEPKMIKAPNWFSVGLTTSDGGGRGTERFQGQHDKYLFFVLDEAEGVPDFVYNAVVAMMTGGTVILWLLLANPRTRNSEFFKLSRRSGVNNYRLSVLNHPNVVQGREVVPNATTREWVQQRILDWCEPQAHHDDDAYTFNVGYDVGEHPAGTVFRPNTEFLFRVMGVAPANIADDTFCPVGRYEAACNRAPEENLPTVARMGIDAAGYGNDFGTLYIRWNGKIWRSAQLSKLTGDQDPTDYWQKTRREALKLADVGVKSLHVRIDAGGGFGNGVYDRLKRDAELIERFPGVDAHGRPNFYLRLVHFNGTPKTRKAYYDLATEMYAEAAEALKSLSVFRPPAYLEADLCERRFLWVNKSGVEVRKLMPKDTFRKEHSRSPDDGDGFVLAAAPDCLFTDGELRVVKEGKSY